MQYRQPLEAQRGGSTKNPIPVGDCVNNNAYAARIATIVRANNSTNNDIEVTIIAA